MSFRTAPTPFVALIAAAGLGVLSAAGPAAAGGPGVLSAASPAVGGLPGVWVAAPAVPLPAKSPDAALRDVVVLGQADVWTVGVARDLPYTAHWTGAGWAAAPFPGRADLQAVDAAAPDDVWAGGSEAGNPVLARWDGTAWTVAGPAAPPGAVFGIDLLPGGDGWAVGGTEPAGPLVMHREGGVWSVETVRVAAGATLHAVAAVSATDAWAVGSRPGVAGLRVPVALRRTVDGWSDVVLPPTRDAELDGVAADRTGAAWAVGSACSPLCGTYTLGLTGAGVQLLPSVLGFELYEAVVPCPEMAPCAAGVWFLGGAVGLQTEAVDHTERWDGTLLTCESISRPVVGNTKPGSGIALAAADADPTGATMWGVGWTQPGPSTDRIPRVIHRDLH